MYMPKDNSPEFTPPPSGTHLAVCYRIVDLGTQLVEWQGQQKKQHKIMLSWELPDEKMEDGSPFTIHQRYTFSSSEKAKLRQDLEAWRGKKFTEADFGPGGFDIKNVLGVGCYLSIVHNSKDGKTYANISGIVKLPKGVQTPEPTNATTYFSLANFDTAAFNALSEGLRSTIMKSPEYHEAIAKKGVGDAGEPAENGHPEFNDEVPF